MARSLLVLTALVAAAAAAPAQFLPARGFNFGYSPAGGGYGVNYGGLNYTYFQTRQLAYSYNNPILGYSRTVNLQFNYFGAVPPGGYNAGPAFNPYAAQAAYLYGGAGGYLSPANNPIAQEQNRLLAGAKFAGGNNRPADPAPQAFARPVPRDQAPGVAIDPALADPPEADVLSGRALNALADAVRPLADRRKGEPPVFPAEVLGHLRFDGPPADAVSLARAGKVEFPPALSGGAFDKLRADIQPPATELLEAVAAGKRSDPMAAERLREAVKQARANFADSFRALGVADALDVSRFLASLDGLAEAGREGGLANLYPAKWATGATAAELLTQMGRQKLTFGPAQPGDEDAYSAVHKGLVGYLASLQTVRR